MLEIDLDAPSRLNGVQVRAQSLWFLLRLYWCQHANEPWLQLSDLRAQFPHNKNLRMLVSRVFADFAKWGVRVGFGTDTTCDPKLLWTSARSRGPFWLAPGEHKRLRVRCNGKKASQQQLQQWLALKTNVIRDARAEPPLVSINVAFLQTWAEARKRVLDGQLVSGESGALASYRRAQALSLDTPSRALSLLQQAMVWRRAGNSDAALQVLDQLEALWSDTAALPSPWLGAMAAIVRAWCAYANRDIDAAKQILGAAMRDARWSAVFAHHPRVQSEYANLSASIARSQALDESLPAHERATHAQQALSQFQSALSLANESELFDAAASAASNLGWSLWLFRRTHIAGQDRIDQPLTWIALAAWLSERFGASGGSWNSIYLLRILRDGGPQLSRPELAQFRRWPVPTLQDYRALSQLPTWPWSDLSGLQLVRRISLEVTADQKQIDALQSANLALELTWYEAHSGELARAKQALLLLQKRLRELNPRDRIFFREQIRLLPAL